MLSLKPSLLVLAFACCATAACSHAANASTAASAAGGNAAPLEDCNKVFAPGDAAGILLAPAKVTNYGPSGNSCSLDTASGASIVVVFLPADNVIGQMLWKEDSAKAEYAPLAGVGDRAIWKKGYGAYVEILKNGGYCAVQLFGVDSAHSMHDITKGRGEALAKQLGALCNKVFAASP
jgi:hypothetical protein